MSEKESRYYVEWKGEGMARVWKVEDPGKAVSYDVSGGSCTCPARGECKHIKMAADYPRGWKPFKIDIGGLHNGVFRDLLRIFWQQGKKTLAPWYNWDVEGSAIFAMSDYNTAFWVVGTPVKIWVFDVSHIEVGDVPVDAGGKNDGDEKVKTPKQRDDGVEKTDVKENEGVGKTNGGSVQNASAAVGGGKKTPDDTGKNGLVGKKVSDLPQRELGYSGSEVTSATCPSCGKNVGYFIKYTSNELAQGHVIRACPLCTVVVSVAGE